MTPQDLESTSRTKPLFPPFGHHTILATWQMGVEEATPEGGFTAGVGVFPRLAPRSDLCQPPDTSPPSPLPFSPSWGPGHGPPPGPWPVGVQPLPKGDMDLVLTLCRRQLWARTVSPHIDARYLAFARPWPTAHVETCLVHGCNVVQISHGLFPIAWLSQGSAPSHGTSAFFSPPLYIYTVVRPSRYHFLLSRPTTQCS